MHIVNVDTDRASAAALQLLLQVAGHTVVTVPTVADIDECSGVGMIFISPDFLNDSDGLSALKGLRTKTQVPVIALLEDPVDPFRKRALTLNAGADACMMRPVDRKNVLFQVDRLTKLNGRCLGTSHRSAPKGLGSQATGEAPLVLTGRTHIANMCQQV